MELKVSDLFQKKGKTFDFSQRIQDQEYLITRIKEMNADILNANAIPIVHIAEELQEYIGEGYAPMPYIEYILGKLQKLGVTVT